MVRSPTNQAELRQGLSLLMHRPDLTAAEVDREVDRLIRRSVEHDFSLEHCLVSGRGGRILAAGLCVDAPGRMSSVFVPTPERPPRDGDEVFSLLAEAGRRAQDRGMQFLQAMVAPESEHEAAVYRMAGFEWLARLTYMQSDLTQPLLSGRRVPELSWIAYDDETHGLFRGVLQASYADSLDCPALSGRRSIDDILASHRGMGEFDPRMWQVGVVGGVPIGVVLVSRTAVAWSHELAYMGVVSAHRRQGYGGALLARAVELARESAGITLSLSVDEANRPARKLYERFGFFEVACRDAWIRFL